MDYIWPLLLIVLNTIWLILILPGVPGTWLMVATAVAVDWLVAGPGSMFSIWTVAVAAMLAGLGEVLEFFAGMGGASKAGGTWRGLMGALVGGLIGAIVLGIPVPCLGTLLGASLGAAAGTILMEMSGGMATEASMRVGIGAGVGRFVGTLIKLILGGMIWVILAVGALR